MERGNCLGAVILVGSCLRGSFQRAIVLGGNCRRRNSPGGNNLGVHCAGDNHYSYSRFDCPRTPIHLKIQFL